uniref:CSON012752 protein n=1 Tax=Culicoides sonorensis TaxID=179676 RepID=A0A336M693_CULSO
MPLPTIPVATIKLCVAALGVFLGFFAFGILQERVTRRTYGGEDGEEPEKFSYFQALVGFLCLFYYLCAQVCHLVAREKKDTSRKLLYLIAAIAYLSAMLCSNMALKWVAYPIQVVAKSAKPIPTIILTALIGKRKYTWKKYLFVFIIVIGVALFIYEGKKDKGVKEKVWYGELLLLCSLLLDGLCGGFEERIRKESSPAPFSMMLAMNGISATILIVAALGTGEATDFISFVTRHPEVLEHLSLMALAGAFGQVCIFYMVSHFGPLPCSIVTTTRKFFTVMFSVIFFQNPLALHQWIGTVFVFGGLFGDIFCNKKPKHEPEALPTTDPDEKQNNVPLATPESPLSDQEEKKAMEKLVDDKV